jgi:hypothetical protein
VIRRDGLAQLSGLPGAERAARLLDQLEHAAEQSVGNVERRAVLCGYGVLEVLPEPLELSLQTRRELELRHEPLLEIIQPAALLQGQLHAQRDHDRERRCGGPHDEDQLGTQRKAHPDG